MIEQADIKLAIDMLEDMHQEEPCIENINIDHVINVLEDCGNEIASLRKQLADAKVDAERLDYLQNKLPETVIRLADTWYWRTGYGRPHKKASSLRNAIDTAIKESKDAN